MRKFFLKPKEKKIIETKASSSVKPLGEDVDDDVRIDPLFDAHYPARAFGTSATFEPEVRTEWHTHPLGQALIVSSGRGLAQSWVLR